MNKIQIIVEGKETKKSKSFTFVNYSSRTLEETGDFLKEISEEYIQKTE